VAYNLGFNGARASATPLFDGVEPVDFQAGERRHEPAQPVEHNVRFDHGSDPQCAGESGGESAAGTAGARSPQNQSGGSGRGSGQSWSSVSPA